MPGLEGRSNDYSGRTIHDQGKVFVGWNRTLRKLGVKTGSAALDCDRLLARRLGVTVKEIRRRKVNQI